MLYIRLLPLLLLLVYPIYIRGVNGEELESRDETVYSEGETLQELRKILNERSSDDECTLLPKCVTEILKRQEKKIDEALNVLKVHGFTASKPRSCAEIEGGRGWGVHRIYPNLTHSIPASCDKSAGGGWTVIQNRVNGDVDFFRGWNEYAEGFGDPAGDYWLGLSHIHALTKAQPMELYVRVIDFDLGSRYAKYSSFSVASEEEKFRLNIGGYTGNAGDSLAFHNGQSFSTKDQDNDSDKRDCSKSYHGAWWYKAVPCHYSNLNGPFTKVRIFDDPKYMEWRKLHNKHIPMKASVMMIRPVNFTPSV